MWGRQNYQFKDKKQANIQTSKQENLRFTVAISLEGEG
jgi:hypothetical protein